MNAVILAVVVMLVLSVARVHVVLSLLIGALVGGLAGGLGLNNTILIFERGLAGGAKIAMSYAMLGAFAVAISYSGLPLLMANFLVKKIDVGAASTSTHIKWVLLSILVVVSILSQNIVPIHIAFIPLLIPPLLIAMTRLHLDRRAVACVMTFGLVATYMFLPYGFGDIFLKQILLGNIEKSGLNVVGINVMTAMTIPAIGMAVGLLIALFITYKKPRKYLDTNASLAQSAPVKVTPWRITVALLAIIISFAAQLYTKSMMMGALLGFALFMASGVIRLRDADNVFTQGVKMMAMIGFIMIAAQGFAEVIKETNHIGPLVEASSQLFAGSKGLAALVMLLVGLLVTLGIGSSFSTVPILAAIYVPLCISMGFSPLATVALIGTAGALGDAGSPASDSTLGPTAGLNADGQHDHMRDTVIPTFLHFNLPLLVAGWIAAMIL